MSTQRKTQSSSAGLIVVQERPLDGIVPTDALAAQEAPAPSHRSTAYGVPAGRRYTCK